MAEVGLLAAAMLTSTLVPQLSRGAAEVERFAEHHPALAALTSFVGLDRTFTSVWFLALVVLAGASLSLVLRDQWRRSWRLWRRRTAGAQLSGAPLRYEVEVRLPEPLRESRIRRRDSLRIGLWGSPLFHLGLLVLVLAGLIRLLFGVEAVVDLIEGETLPASTPSAYGAQWPGLLARPFSLSDPLTLSQLHVERYPSGSLRAISAEVELGDEHRILAINGPLSQGTSTLYLTATHGPAVRLATDLGGTREGHALLLRAAPGGRYTAKLVLPDGTLIRASTREQTDPGRIDLRVVRAGALLASANLSPGEGIRLPGAGALELRDVSSWVRVVAQRDASTAVVYTGFGLACAGALLMYGVIRVESSVVWQPTEQGVLLKVAMRPHRFAPLFTARFEGLVAESQAELSALGVQDDV